MSVAFKTPVWALAIGAFAMFAPAPAVAAPTALVEDVSDGVAGVRAMDYLHPGRKVTLAPGQSLTLSYLDTCVNETITGGGVTIGTRESTVTGGKIDRHTLPCDGGKLLLAANETGKAGVSVFRSAPFALADAKPTPDLTLYKTRPLLVVATPGPVTILRLDVADAAPLTIDMSGTILDTAKGGTALVPGGLYKVAAGAKSYVVRIDPQAKDAAGPALGRLIRF